MFWCSSEQDEMVKVIYKISDNVKGHDPNTEEEDADNETRPEAQHTGGDTAWSRSYKLPTVCVVLLCVLLLTAVIVLWIKLTILYTESNRLQTSYNNLTIERDQLQTSYNNLTVERDQLQRERDGYLGTFCDLYKGRCFSYSLYFISTEKKNWTESRQDCRERGADLVIINSKEEQEFINSLRGGGQPWIGLSDRDRENKWKWVDDTPLITGFWGHEEPNSYAGDEDCVITGDKPDPVWTWADYPCDSEFIWICEKTIFN